jgi:hypothetical protein
MQRAPIILIHDRCRRRSGQPRRQNQLNREFGRREQSMTLRLTQRLRNVRLKLEWAGIFSLDDGSGILRPRMTKQIDDRFTIAIGVDHAYGSADTTFGSRRNNSLGVRRNGFRILSRPLGARSRQSDMSARACRRRSLQSPQMHTAERRPSSWSALGTKLQYNAMGCGRSHTCHWLTSRNNHRRSETGR